MITQTEQILVQRFKNEFHNQTGKELQIKTFYHRIINHLNTYSHETILSTVSEK